MLIPFQGRLTDTNGVPYTHGPYTITFNLYDQAVGGTVLWTETHQQVGIINGMVNVFLGSINSLTNVTFDQARHLGITIDADGNPNTPDPEMVPRQMIIPAFWAKHAEDSSKLAGYDWSAILVNGNANPETGQILASKLQTIGITAQQIAPQTITSGQLAPASVTANQIAPGTIVAANLSPSLQLNFIPAGAIMPFGGTNIPAGWLLCDGTPLNSAQYPALYSAIGANWGAGSGTNNFNLPDLRGMFLRGMTGARADSFADPDVGSRTASANGGNSGNAVGSVQSQQIQTHSHEVRHTTPSDPQNNNVSADNSSVNNNGVAGRHGGPLGYTMDAGGSETRPNNAYVNYIIKY